MSRHRFGALDVVILVGRGEIAGSNDLSEIERIEGAADCVWKRTSIEQRAPALVIGRDKKAEVDLGPNGSFSASEYAMKRERRRERSRDRKRKREEGDSIELRVPNLFSVRQNASRTIDPWCIAAYGVNQATANQEDRFQRYQPTLALYQLARAYLLPGAVWFQIGTNAGRSCRNVYTRGRKCIIAIRGAREQNHFPVSTKPFVRYRG